METFDVLRSSNGFNEDTKEPLKKFDFWNKA